MLSGALLISTQTIFFIFCLTNTKQIWLVLFYKQLHHSKKKRGEHDGNRQKGPGQEDDGEKGRQETRGEEDRCKEEITPGSPLRPGCQFFESSLESKMPKFPAEVAIAGLIALCLCSCTAQKREAPPPPAEEISPAKEATLPSTSSDGVTTAAAQAENASPTSTLPH
jgi:hypothetical protein